MGAKRILNYETVQYNLMGINSLLDGPERINRSMVVQCAGCNRTLIFPEKHWMHTCDACIPYAEWDINNGGLKFDFTKPGPPTPFEEVMRRLARLNPDNPELDKFRSESK